jgi:arylsulfatase A
MLRDRNLYRDGGTCLVQDDKLIGKESPYFDKYLTDIFAEEAIKQIKKFNALNQPFFLNLWWLAPHTPYEPAPEPHWSQTADEEISDDQHRFRSMVARMDYQVGRILDTLDRLKIANNTLVIFLSDNGGAYEANIGELKGGKTDLHEGGIRVPFLARWPGRIKVGSVSNEIGHSTDLLPTICSAAEIPLPKNLKLDGINLLPLLQGERKQLERNTVFWQLNLYKHLQRHYDKPKPYATEIARRNRWKMLALNGKPVELFDIEEDIEEKNNLIHEHPDVVKSMNVELQDWLTQPRQPFGRAE